MDEVQCSQASMASMQGSQEWPASQDTTMISASQLCSQDCSQEPPRPSDEFEDWGEEQDWVDTQEEADKRSALPLVAGPRCLLPDTKVLCKGYGPVEAVPGLQEGVEVRSNQVFVKITKVEVHPPAKITTVTVRFANGDGMKGAVTVTDSHRFLVKRGASNSWGPQPARAVLVGDELKGPSGDVCKVLGTELKDDERGVVQVWLEDNAATMYVAGFGEDVFVEAYGTEPPKEEPEVEILRFSTSGGLKEQLHGSVEIKQRFDDLESVEVSSELHERDLGYALLAVRKDLVGSTLMALRDRQRRKRSRPDDKNGGRLLSSEVVVSRDLKAKLIQVAIGPYKRPGQTGRGAGKHRYLKTQYCEALELCEVPDEVIGGPPAKRPRVADDMSVVTASTTAARDRVATQLRPLGR